MDLTTVSLEVLDSLVATQQEYVRNGVDVEVALRNLQVVDDELARRSRVAANA